MDPERCGEPPTGEAVMAAETGAVLPSGGHGGAAAARLPEGQWPILAAHLRSIPDSTVTSPGLLSLCKWNTVFSKLWLFG